MDKIFTQKESEKIGNRQEKDSLKSLIESSFLNTKDEPSESVITAILNYSKVLECKKSKHIDCIEIILN